MGITFRAEHLKRYKDIAWLLIKHGRADWVRQIGLDKVLNDLPEEPVADERQAEEFADDLERMGPTFVKLGQLLSSRADLLPPRYLDALTRLQDDVEPFSFDEVQELVSTELGQSISRAFWKFDPEPLAAASLGQVHEAVLLDARRVVVKVQRPDIRHRIAVDLDALEDIAEFLDHHTEWGRRYAFRGHLAEFRKSILNELDYRLEAGNLRAIAENLSDFSSLVVPRPIDDYCTTRVLTMQAIQGAKIDALPPGMLTRERGHELAEDVFKAYLQQVLVDGFFHADPHPGNIYLMHDGRLALLDLGMVARITPALQNELVKLLLAISEGRGEDAAEIAISIGEELPKFRRNEFKRQVAEFVAEHYNARIEHIQAGRVMLEIQRLAGKTGIRQPPSLTMLAKTLLNLDRLAHILDAEFDPAASIRRNAMSILRRRMLKSLTPSNLVQTMLETGDLLQKLPGRLNALLDAWVNSEIRLNIDAVDEAQLIRGIHRIANRITAGLVLAALIIGAALMMRIETDFTILGYPGVAMILFAIAAGGGMILVFRIMFQDQRSKKEIDARHQEHRK